MKVFVCQYDFYADGSHDMDLPVVFLTREGAEAWCRREMEESISSNGIDLDSQDSGWEPEGIALGTYGYRSTDWRTEEWYHWSITECEAE